MLILPIEQAKPGQTLAAPVFHPAHPEQALLKRGYCLEFKILLRLRELGVEHLFVTYPGLDELDQHLAPYLSPTRSRLYSQIRETITACQNHTRPSVSYHDYYHAIRDFVLTLHSQGQHPLYLDMVGRLGGQAVGHAAAVAHLGLALGIALERYLINQRSRLEPTHAREVVNIGVAGMLHDMGKLKLPSRVRHYDALHRPQDPEQNQAYEEHAHLGYELIRNGVEPSASTAVLQHHQRFDGEGFPALRCREGGAAPSAGERIHIFGRILAAADLYDRLSICRRTKRRRSNIEILHLLRTRWRSWIDPVVHKALERVAPPFPPGSQVQLSDGTQAVVVRIGTGDPFRPIVRRAEAMSLGREEVDLRLPDSPQIQRIGGRDIGHLIPAEDASAASTAA